jgi:RNA polymerase sigma factor (sigma-70 family)
VQRSAAERDRLVEQFLPLVRYVVARLPVTMPAWLDRDDFYSVGLMGLMHAASTFDPSRGASFKTFAYTASHLLLELAVIRALSELMVGAREGSTRRRDLLKNLALIGCIAAGIAVG